MMRGHTESRSWYAHQVGIYALTRARQSLRPWKNVVLLSLGTPAIYILTLGLGLGGSISGDLEGVPYPTYVASGAFIGTIATIFGGYALWPVSAGFDGNKSFVIACNAPLTPGQVAIGEMTAISIRVGIQAVTFWAVGFLCGLWQLGASLLMVPISILVGASIFAPLCWWTASHPGAEGHFAPLYRLLFAFYLLGGAFSPVDSLPHWAQIFSKGSPVTYGLRSARSLLNGGPVGSALIHLIPLLFCTAIGIFAMCRAFKTRLEG